MSAHSEAKLGIRALRAAATHIARASYTTHPGDQARASALHLAARDLAQELSDLADDMGRHLAERRKRSPSWQETKGGRHV